MIGAALPSSDDCEASHVCSKGVTSFTQIKFDTLYGDSFEN